MLSPAGGAYFSLRQRKVSKEGRYPQGEFSCNHENRKFTLAAT
jgi:hypothetical protein